MTFFKSEFCGLHKNDLMCYPMCFGGREIAKNKVSKVLVDTLYVLKGLQTIKKLRLIIVFRKGRHLISQNTDGGI